MKIIDMRVRPPFQPYLESFYDETYDGLTAVKNFAPRFGMKMAPSVREKSLPMLLEKMAAANITTGVVSIRQNQRGYENDALIELLEQYPDKFVGACGLSAIGGQESIDIIKKYVVDGPCVAPFLEPGMNGLHLDDERIFAIYDYCAQNDIPLMISFGGLHGTTPEYCNATHAAIVAQEFPKLKMVLCHAGWPWVETAVQVAFREPGVYLSPDLYSFHVAGGRDYIEAANYMLSQKFMFGSAYPCADMESAVAYYLENLRPEVIENIMYKNAANFLKLEN